ncbi:hypothetical protein M422DRAFT_164299, partial [Sphaerobolus stellatus SS14]
SFTWHLDSSDLRVNALKFPVAKGIKFSKDVNLSGINNFDGNVKLVNFELPADSPDGGIEFTATTELNNPSPFNVDLGFALFNLTYKGLYLGQGLSTQTQIKPGGNNITLNGRLIQQTGSENLATIGELFSNYLNSEPGTMVVAKGVSTHQQDGGDISWLSQGLQSLSLNVPFIPAVPVNPIQAIEIGFLNLSFTPQSAYAPLTSSDSVLAALKLPFGFNINISQIANSFAIMQNNAIVGNLTTNFGQSSSAISVLGPMDTEGNINITLNNSPLLVPDDGHATFNSFAMALTSSDEVEFNLVGQADANSNLAIGAVTLNPIKFSVPSKLKGLGGLKGSTTINTVDVTGGTTDHIDLAIAVTIVNPSALNLNTGDLTLQLLRGGSVIGTTLLPNLSLAMGSNKLETIGSFTPNLNSQGQQTLNDFIGGKDVAITIAGFDGSTQVASLLDAFKTLNIDATLPALNSSLLETASLQILSTTDVINNIAHVTVSLANPFTGGLTITGINSTVTSHGLTLGTINTETNFAAAGKKTTESPTLDFNMNLDPPIIFTLLRRLAVQAGQDTTQIDGIVALGGITYVSSTDADNAHINTKRADASTFANFDLPSFVDKAFTQLQSDIELTSAVSIGDYATSLQFTQSSVPVKTDESLNMLLPILAQPIVQKIITGSELSIDTVIISNPQQTSFVTALKGSITNAGPFDAEIDFGPGLTIAFSGQPLGTIQMPKVQLKGDVGATLDVTATFNQITLNANIPALHQNLITATNIVFPLNILSTGIAAVTVNLANPFTASINLLVLQATATFGNITLGTVPRVDTSANPVHAAGHSNITTPTLPLAFNLDPTAIITLLSTRAAQKSIDVGPLTQLFQLALANPTAGKDIVATIDTNGTTCNSGNQFDVDSAILNALEGLEVTLDVQTTLKLDDFQTELSFKQFNVPAITGQTALFLIGAVAPPIVQTLVSSSVLSFDVANITNISDEGFDLSLHGSLLGTGPLDALITFVEPVNVNWQGHDIATIALPPVCAAANVGVPNYEAQGRLTISNLEAFTEFATFLLHNPSFDWTISTGKLRLNALGTNFDNVQLSKTVTFKAFNGLPGVTISNFQLPGDDPAGGITISTDSDIPSPAAIGIQLGTVSFTSSFNGVEVGPLTGTGLFLGADETTKTHLDGRIIPQSDDDLKTIGKLFSNFLAGKNQTLTVTGNAVDPNGNNQPVSWLSTAFKTLSLDVTLPGQVFEIIHSINIQDLELQLVSDSQDFAPSASSKTTVATFSNPFGFSLQVVEAAEDLTINFNGQDTASLALPLEASTSGVSTGNNADLILSFSNQTLKSLNNAAFGSFFARVTDTQSAAVILKGSANIVAKTSIGNVPISGIPFNVDSSIGGINSFNGQASLSNVTIAGSGGTNGNQFIITPLTTTLQNPSNITLNTNGISLPVFFENVQIGRAVIDEFDLVPGMNVVPSEFHYMPADSNDTTAQSFLSSFLVSADTLPLTIKGDSASSPFGSLVPALEGVSLSTSLKGYSLFVRLT